MIFCWSTQALLAVADFARAAEWIEAVESCGVGGIPGDCRVHRAEVLRALGQPDRAEAEATAARTEVQAVDLLHARIAHYELAMIQLSRGEFDESRTLASPRCQLRGNAIESAPLLATPSTSLARRLADRTSLTIDLLGITRTTRGPGWSALEYSAVGLRPLLADSRQTAFVTQHDVVLDGVM